MARAGVRWHRHRWGRPGPVGGVARMLRGVAYLRGAELVHARSDLPAAAASARADWPYVWDMRAFFREDRVSLGTLRPGSPEDRWLGRIERRLGRTAHGVVTLGEAAVPVLKARHGAAIRDRTEVIPTCVDLQRFGPSALPPGPVRLGLVGTLNRLYDVPAMLRLAAAASATVAVVTPGPTAWDRELAAARVDRRSASPDEMPGVLTAVHAGLCVQHEPSPAAMPTKIGEFLASGRPVVVSPGLGDMDTIVRTYRCGVVLDDTAAAADELHALLDDPEVVDRCRRAAEVHFDVDEGVRRLLRLYRRIAA